MASETDRAEPPRGAEGLRAVLGDRSLFPELSARAYLNHGGISPASLAAVRGARAVLDDYARRGSAAFVTWATQRERLRGKLATLVNAASSEDVAFVPNTTRGVTDVALCFPWRAGDRVLLFAGEFPSNVTPWQRAAELFGARAELLPLSGFERSTEDGLADLENALRHGGVRLVAVSAVQFQTGLRMPLAEIAAACRRHGAKLFVDAVQACGAVPVDVRACGVDYLACGSHKWLMGVEGAGFLYVNPERVGELRPSVAGWLSHEDPVRFLFEGKGHLRYDRPVRRRADFVEGGNYNTAGLAALEGALDLIQQLGVERVYEHANRFHDALEPALVARGFRSLRAREPARRSCTLGVLPPDGLALGDVFRALAARGVVCATPDGVLRFTPHWPNALAEVELVCEAVDAALISLTGPGTPT